MGDASVFLLNDTATTEIYTLSLHDALPISAQRPRTRRPPPAPRSRRRRPRRPCAPRSRPTARRPSCPRRSARSEEHTSELQSRQYLVCRLLLEKKKLSYIPLSCDFIIIFLL